ncbi:Rv3654c family TadE-like protein [Angustibacter speluncae]
MRARAPRTQGDEGAGSVLVVALVAVLGVGALGVTTVGQAVLARHRAGTAADLAALAAASAAWPSTASGRCADEVRAAARQVAAANRGALVGCRADGASVEVVVTVPVEGPAASVGPARATARAGPAP